MVRFNDSHFNYEPDGSVVLHAQLADCCTVAYNSVKHQLLSPTYFTLFDFQKLFKLIILSYRIRCKTKLSRVFNVVTYSEVYFANVAQLVALDHLTFIFKFHVKFS